MPIDLPDRTAAADYPKGTTREGSPRSAPTVVIDKGWVTATPPSWRLDIRQAADLDEEVLRTEGLRGHTSSRRCRRPGRVPHQQKRRRAIGKVTGAQRLRSRSCQPRSRPSGSVRPVGPATRRLTPLDHPRDQPAGIGPAEACHHPAAGALRGLGPQRVLRGRSNGLVLDRPGRRTHIETRQAAYPNRDSRAESRRGLHDQTRRRHINWSTSAWSLALRERAALSAARSTSPTRPKAVRAS